MIRRFKAFCRERGETKYTPAFRKAYAEDVTSIKTGKFSPNHFYTQGRPIHFLGSYFISGAFDFAIKPRGRVSPKNLGHKVAYQEYGSFLRSEYSNENTARYYEYEMYCLLQYMDSIGIGGINYLTPAIIVKYLHNSKPSRQSAVLCGLRRIFKYLGREDLLASIAGPHAQRTKRIIPVLTEAERQSLIE